jgi:hypothetical protein
MQLFMITGIVIIASISVNAAEYYDGHTENITNVATFTNSMVRYKKL